MGILGILVYLKWYISYCVKYLWLLRKILIPQHLSRSDHAHHVCILINENPFIELKISSIDCSWKFKPRHVLMTTTSQSITLEYCWKKEVMQIHITLLFILKGSIFFLHGRIKNKKACQQVLFRNWSLFLTTGPKCSFLVFNEWLIDILSFLKVLLLLVFLILKGFSSGTENWLFHSKFQSLQIKNIGFNE